MTVAMRWHVGAALVLLLLTLGLGMVAAFAFVFPDLRLPFEQLRPMHVSCALFWIITGATAGVLHFRREVFGGQGGSRAHVVFLVLWIATITGILMAYAARRFGGREYWEFPPWLCVPLLLAWLVLLADHFGAWMKRPKSPPLHVWMWSTGVLFFLITFLEQNLYQIPWFRETYLREITVQWKSNGAMVGAWNQMIYGTGLHLMVKLTGDERIARGPKVFFFYFLGLSNLMFNWGHHLYNAPTASWMRHVAYAISMTEWILLISILRGFKAKMTEQRLHGHRLTYRFLLASELWVFLNLLLALFMSIPAINRYTHGTHITVAHAMGATIGINTMILLAALGWMLGMDAWTGARRRWIERARRIMLWSLLIFWLALIIAGVLKGYRDLALGIADFQQMMEPVFSVLKVFAFAGLGLLAGLGTIAVICLRATMERARSVSG